MAEIINLRQARKRKARTDKEAEAAANRVAFGRTKRRTTAERGRAGTRGAPLEGHKRDETPE